MKLFQRLSYLAALFSFLAGVVVGQTTNGSIVGTVTDPSGSPVPGVEIKILNKDTGLQRSATIRPERKRRVFPVGFSRTSEPYIYSDGYLVGRQGWPENADPVRNQHANRRPGERCVPVCREGARLRHLGGHYGLYRRSCHRQRGRLLGDNFGDFPDKSAGRRHVDRNDGTMAIRLSCKPVLSPHAKVFGPSGDILLFRRNGSGKLCIRLDPRAGNQGLFARRDQPYLVIAGNEVTSDFGSSQ